MKRVRLLVTLSVFGFLVAGCGGNALGAMNPIQTSPVIATSALTDGIEGIDYNTQLTVSGGATPYTWSDSGGLPPGLSLATDGTISGIPTARGPYSFTVTVTDGNAETDSRNLAITVQAGVLTILNTSLSSATTGSTYNLQLNATGGVSPYVWSSSALPPNLTLVPSTGVVSGVILAALTYSITFTVLDDVGTTVDQTLELVVDQGVGVPDSWVTPSGLTAGTTDAPSPRYHHTAVWTGTTGNPATENRMIVWGGRDENGDSLGEGAIYNPDSDRWEAPSGLSSGAPDAPSARLVHSAVWTGTGMIIWGGYDGTAHVNTGAIYDPAADSWTRPARLDGGTGCPDGRSAHATIWTGTLMVIWGGKDEVVGDVVNNGITYDPASDSWSSPLNIDASGLSPREGMIGVYTGTDVIIFGGANIMLGLPLSDGEIYDLAGDAWSQPNGLDGSVNTPSGRWYFTGVWADTEMIVWGGIDDGQWIVQDGNLYDPLLDQWDQPMNLGSNSMGAPSARYGQSAVWTGSEMIIWGGRYNMPGNDSVYDDGGMYTP